MSSNSSSYTSSSCRPSFAAVWHKWIRSLVEYYIPPGVIAAYFGTHLWFTIYFYAWRRLLWACSHPDNKMIDYTAHHCEPSKAVALLTAEGVLTLLVVLPWYYCFVTANIWARWFVKMPTWVQQKQFYQVDWDTGLARSYHRCLGHPAMLPRWYHMSSLGMEKCLPLDNHTCPWLGAAVYLYNLKAYVLTVTLLPLHFLTTFVLSIFALLENPHNRFTARIVFLMLTSLLFAIPVATGTTARVWSEVIFLDRVMLDEMPAQHTPQSTRTTLAHLMPSIRRRNVGSDDYELDMV
ncbi:hypothetical protein KCU61_g2385, partial [Aureobasidium melanogenum]